MSAHDDELLDGISALLSSLLTALQTLAFISRHLHPPDVPALANATSAAANGLRAGLENFRKVSFPDHLASFKQQLETASEHVGDAFGGLTAAAGDADGTMGAYRAMRHYTRAKEALYPIATMLPPVSRFFLEPSHQQDAALLAKLDAADATRADVGVIHHGNAKGERGGFSLYVPEYYNAADAHPLVVALHGGSGHGRDFLWTWIAAARSHGAILLSPTAKERTWSLMGPDIDSGNIDAMIEHVGERWHLERRKMLLTGMSDGGTFCYVSGLRGQSPFTHLAPSSASFHPLLLEDCPKERLAGLPIYLMHGARDWMFPVEMAQMANAALCGAGASVEYRELADLSHVWPHDENSRIMDWFLAPQPDGEQPKESPSSQT